MKLKVATTVNGRRHEHEVEPRLLLVHYLRDNLGLTGTHIGCDTSQCGACTILVDGQEGHGHGGRQLTWRSPSWSDPRSTAAKTPASSPVTATTWMTSRDRELPSPRSYAAHTRTRASRASTSLTRARRPAWLVSTRRATSKGCLPGRIRPRPLSWRRRNTFQSVFRSPRKRSRTRARSSLQCWPRTRARRPMRPT